MKKPSSKLRATPVHGPSNTITTLPPAPIDEQRARMRRYAISMGIRTICVIAVFFVPGWWRLAPAIAAIVLPYFAVVVANAGHDGVAGEVERPGGVEVYRPDPFAGYGGPDPATGSGQGFGDERGFDDASFRNAGFGNDGYRGDGYRGDDFPGSPGPADPFAARPAYDRAARPAPDTTDEPRVIIAPYAPGTEPRRARPVPTGEAQPQPRGEGVQPRPRGDDVQPRPRE